MGDIIFITPALNIIKENFPDAKISVLLPASFSAILEHNIYLDHIIKNHLHPFYDSVNLAKVLKPFNFDLLINFDPVKAHSYKDWLAELKIDTVWSLVNHNSDVSDFDKYNSKKFILSICSPKQHFVDNCLFLLRKAGLNVGSVKLRLDIDKQDRDFIDKLIHKFDIRNERPVIILHPGTSNSNITLLESLIGRIMFLLKGRLPVDRKGWPLEYYRELGGLLKRFCNAQIIITGCDSESRLSKRILKYACFDSIDLCGKTTIGQLAALYKVCSLVIASDTGPLHLAAAVGTPVIGLYGGYSDINHTRPWTEESKYKVMGSNFNCSPCRFDKRRKICLRAECMREIKPQEVLNMAKELIGIGNL